LEIFLDLLFSGFTTDPGSTLLLWESNTEDRVFELSTTLGFCSLKCVEDV